MAGASKLGFAFLLAIAATAGPALGQTGGVNRRPGQTAGTPSTAPPCALLKTAIAAQKRPALIEALKARCIDGIKADAPESCKLARALHFSSRYTGRREEAAYLLSACLTRF